MKELMEKTFHLKENGTNVKTEVLAGITTFFAMCYIIILNPSQMVSNFSDELWNACFVGGILAAFIATICMSFIANKPFALAAGMGLNSFFLTSFILGSNNVVNSYYAGLSVILLSGVIFLILSVTGVRKYLAISLPTCLKKAIPAGIGLFIAFIGLKNGGLVVDNEFTFVALQDFTQPFVKLIPSIVTFIGVIMILVFASSKVKFLKTSSIILGVVFSTVIYYIFMFITKQDINVQFIGISSVFKNFVDHGLFGGIKGFKFVFDGETIGSIITVIVLVVTYCLVDLFDTLGTLYGTSKESNMVDEQGDPEKLDECMLADSIGTVCGALTGTSTITTFVESGAGVASGGRTGLTSLVCAFLFLLCLFVAPIAQYVPLCATAPALIYVGLLMFKNILDIDFKDLRSASTAFFTIIIMILTYSISNGIMVGAIVYTLITLFTFKFSKKDIIALVIAILAVIRFVVIKM